MNPSRDKIANSAPNCIQLKSRLIVLTLIAPPDYAFKGTGLCDSAQIQPS
jgi:hypothetical protein